MVFRQRVVTQRMALRQRAVVQRMVFRHRASTKMRMRVHYLLLQSEVMCLQASEDFSHGLQVINWRTSKYEFHGLQVINWRTSKYKFTPKLSLQLRGLYSACSSANFVGKWVLFVVQQLHVLTSSAGEGPSQPTPY